MADKERWDFPDFGGGQTSGIDGGSAVSTFKGTALPSLEKEVVQNSLDARRNQSEPAVVKFSVFEIATDELPGRNDLLEALNASKERNYNENSENERIEQFFENALKTMREKKMCVMQISDYNTTGLLNPDADILDIEQSKRSRWLGLVHGMGDTDKGGATGGSHGQGKSAALSNSSIRTLFYATIDENGKKAFQGVAYLGSHLKKNGTLSQSVGYYGNAEKSNAPIMECRSLNPQYRRTEAGTDIFVMGFENRDNWQKVLLLSVLNDYLVAIWKGELVVHIGDDIVVSSETLDGIFDQYREAYNTIGESAKNNFADKCLDAIKNPDHQSGPEEVDFYGVKGNIEVFLKTGIGYPKSVAMVRQIGMKVFDKTNQASAMQYVGVMYIQGKELNSFLASLENVQHTAWEAGGNATDSALAKKRLNKLYKYLNEKISVLFENSTSSHMEVDGLEELLGIELDDRDENGNVISVENSNIVDIVVGDIKTPTTKEQYNASSQNGSLRDFGFSESENEEEEKRKEKKKEREKKPDKPDKPDKPEKEPPNKESKAKRNRSLSNNVERPKNVGPIVLTKKAIIGGARGSGEYTLVLESAADLRARIGIVLSGEDSDEIPSIEKAVRKDTGEELTIDKNYIMSAALPAGQTIKILLTLSERIPCALGVTIDAY